MKPESLVQPGSPLPFPHRTAIILSFCLLAVLATRQVSSLDVGFHLRAGEHILEGNGWPRTDPFTFTIQDHPYIDTSWGYQIALALIQRGFDAPGLVVFHVTLVLAVYLIVYRTARLAPSDPTSLALLLLAGGVASEMRFEVRPELVSWLFLAMTSYILHRRAEGRPSPLWALPFIHLVWANMHSLFILGWAALACFLAGLWMRHRRLDSVLFAWSLASIGATLMNPYGWRGVIFPFTLATRLQEQNVFGQSIGEFVSPFDLGLSSQFPFYPRLPVMVFRLLAVLAAVSLVPLFMRRRFWCCLLCLAFLPLAAGMIRNIPLLWITCLPGMIWSFPLGRILEGAALGKAEGKAGGARLSRDRGRGESCAGPSCLA